MGKVLEILNILHCNKNKLCTCHFINHVIKQLAMYFFKESKKASLSFMFKNLKNLFYNRFIIFDFILIILECQ